MREDGFDRRAWARLLLLCAALLFEGMSLSGINVQLVGLRQELRLSPDRLQLVASVFLTVYAGLLLIGGSCADRWGGRRIFRIGVALFGIGSLAAAVAQNALEIVAARAIQGAGAAVTAPAAVALIVALFPAGAARNRALGVLSAIGAVGFTLGVVIGGMLVHRFGWRWAFGFHVPVAALIVFGSLRVPDAAPGNRGRAVPWLPASLATGGLLTLVYATGRVGFGAAGELAALAGTGTVLAVAFVAAQKRSRVPLISPALIGDRRMLAACLALGGAFAGITGAMFLISTSLQDQRAYTALAVGLAFVPQGAAVGILSTPAARLAGRWPLSRLLLSGLALLAGGHLLYTTAVTGGYLTHLLPATILVGAGIAGIYPAATMLTSAVAGPDEQATANGTLITCQQAGGALGIAMAAGVQGLGQTGGTWGLWASLGCVVLALGGCATLLRGFGTVPLEALS